jgi:hypothetical protein
LLRPQALQATSPRCFWSFSRVFSSASIPRWCLGYAQAIGPRNLGTDDIWVWINTY